jgi:hypothetical protein
MESAVLVESNLSLIGGKQNYAGGHHSIIIGEGLSSNKSYHLLIDYEGIKIDRIMSEEEQVIISKVVEAVYKIKTKYNNEN